MMEGQTDCIVQTTGMKEEEREEFLGEFEKERKHSLVGFCVMGGIFGEADRFERGTFDRSDRCGNGTATGWTGAGNSKAVF